MKILAIVIFLALITGCVPGGQNVRNNIEPGMTKDEVFSIMGKPDGFRQTGEFTIYQYTNLMIRGWSEDSADYSFVLKDNKLVEYGSGEVREKNVGGVHTVFLFSY